MDNIITTILPIITLVVGYLLSYWASHKDRKQQKEQFDLNIKQQKEQFDLNIKQQQELFSLERRDKLGMIAIEKRLEAHQLALKHWYALRDVIHEPNLEERNKVIHAAFDFWILNSLFLEKETRRRFLEAINIVSNYQMFLDMKRQAYDMTEKKRLNEMITENWDQFHALHPIIFSEVELEPINSPDKGKDPFKKEG